MADFTADEIRHLLRLEPLTMEGGYFRETYRATGQIPKSALPPIYRGPRSFSTCIYYLLTPDTFSVMHRIPTEEIFHFYLGDPVEMLQLYSDGSGEVITLGTDLRSGMTPQHLVRGGTWQGSRLKEDGRYALMGCTVAPGFEYADYEGGSRADLCRQFPQFSRMIRLLTT
ncbi:MAG TPA: cupin domain-containing protein [Terriglobales bacterium]|nr:cupin domain-containing protein [Terriglobales bacterium]